MSDVGIKELAKTLGISTASVSRALNKPDRVSANMREKVQTAAKKLGYRPNKMGASLRTSKTKNIIVIIPNINDTFNSGVIRSLERTAAERGYSVLFGDTQGIRELEITYGDMVKSRQADGIICFSHRLPFTDEDMQSDSFTLPPIVNSCEHIETTKVGEREFSVPLVTVDNVAASKELTQHLIKLGHKDIAVITGDMNSPSTTQRLQGYRDALREAGLAYKKKLIYEGFYTLEAGSSRTKDILLEKQRPTAIFCMCDETALGCLHALKEHNFNVPKDISVAGFDDIKFAKYFSPPLTTIAQPVEDIGRRCVELLLDIIDKKKIEEANIMLPHSLVVRGSTGPKPK